MSVEIIGMIGAEKGTSNKNQVSVIGSGVSKEHIVNFAKAHEDSGFDKVLVGYRSSAADGFIVAMHAAAHTKSLGFLIAHRPGFVSPTLLARKAATFDQLTRGRIALHIISGGSELEQQKDGDFLTKEDRYRRSGEFMHIIKRIWSEDSPFDFSGEFYKFNQAFSDVDCYQKPRIPVYFGGSSEIALNIGAKECDVYATFGEPLSDVSKKINDFKKRVKDAGRNTSEIRFSVSTRPIVADTEKEAWDRAYDTLAAVQDKNAPYNDRTMSAGSKRLVYFAKKGDIQDERLYMPIAAATGGTGNSTALVGTADQVSESLLNYYKIGGTTILIRGFNPIEDAIYWGKELIPLLREKVKKYHKENVVTAIA